jgi:oligopeptide/dipeptide ABC transporter ATP-binding protein
MSLLRVENLTTWFRTDLGVLRAVTDVSLELERGRTLGIVGESGSGKSVLTRSIMRVQPDGNLARSSGHVWLDDVDLMTLKPSQLRLEWLRRMSIVPQNPLSSLNPVKRIGSQLREILHYRFRVDRREARSRAASLLEQVGIADPLRRLDNYPHELSGGMRQRVAIAMALAGEPDLLIADEPTTALDVTVQAQILELLRSLREERNMAMIFVSHDIAVVAGLADEIAVMYGGRIVEQAAARAVVHDPRMPYSEALLRSSPRLDQARGTALAVIPGRPPSMVADAGGCSFAPRCARAADRCRIEAPPLLDDARGRRYACWYPVGA